MRYMIPGSTKYKEVVEEQLKYHPGEERSAWKADEDQHGRTYYWNGADVTSVLDFPPGGTRLRRTRLGFRPFGSFRNPRQQINIDGPRLLR